MSRSSLFAVVGLAVDFARGTARRSVRRRPSRRLCVEPLEFRWALSHGGLPVLFGDDTDTAVAVAIESASDADGEVDVATGTQLHVADIGFTFVSGSSGHRPRGQNFLAYASVDVVDEFGNPAADVAVTGDFSGVFEMTGVSATSDGRGHALIPGESTFCNPKTPGTLTFTVTSLTKPGLTYDPSANSVTSESTLVCNFKQRKITRAASDAALAEQPALLSGAGSAADAEAAVEIHVADIQFWFNSGGIGRGKSFSGVTVTIHDAQGNPVSGAVVSGSFSGLYSLEGASASTNSNGLAVITGKVHNCKPGRPSPLTFTVTDVVLEGFVWDAMLTSASINTCD